MDAAGLLRVLCIVKEQSAWPCSQCSFKALDHAAVHSHLVTCHGSELSGSSEHIAYLTLHQLVAGLYMAFLAGSWETAVLQWTSQPAAPELIVPDSDAGSDVVPDNDRASPAVPQKLLTVVAPGDMAEQISAGSHPMGDDACTPALAQHPTAAVGVTPASIHPAADEQQPARLQHSEQAHLNKPAAEVPLALHTVTSLPLGFTHGIDLLQSCCCPLFCM